MNPMMIDCKQGDFSDQELSALGEVLLKADEIREDKELSRMVEKHMAKKAGKINSLSDLRKKANEMELDNEDMSEEAMPKSMKKMPERMLGK